MKRRQHTPAAAAAAFSSNETSRHAADPSLCAQSFLSARY